MWWLGLKTLLADKGKFFVALFGVVFSTILVNLQGGLFLGLIQKASLLVENTGADIWVGHRHMHDVESPKDIPRRWVNRIRPLPGVKRAEPLLVGASQMSLPSGGFEAVVVVGVDRDSLLGNAWNVVEGTPEAVLKPDGVLVDQFEDDKLESPRVGELREIGGRKARIVGKTQGIVGFVVLPYVFTTFEQAGAYLGKSAESCSYLLVQLEPGTDVRNVCDMINKQIPEVDAHPTQVYGKIAVTFWMTRTGIGISFGLAAFLGLLVGLVTVGQTLYAMVLDRVAEFAALKAIGAQESQIIEALLAQVLTIAIGGLLLAFALIGVILRFYDAPRAPILIPWWLSLGSCLLVVAICLASAILPYLRVRRVDPVTVMQG